MKKSVIKFGNSYWYICIPLVWATLEDENWCFCYEQNVYVPPNTYVEAPTPSMVVLGGGAFGK